MIYSVQYYVDENTIADLAKITVGFESPAGINIDFIQTVLKFFFFFSSFFCEDCKRKKRSQSDSSAARPHGFILLEFLIMIYSSSMRKGVVGLHLSLLRCKVSAY